MSPGNAGLGRGHSEELVRVPSNAAVRCRSERVAIDGLSIVQQRIAAIEARIGVFRAPPVSQPAVGTGPGMQQLARDVGRFDAAYQRAVDAQAGASSRASGSTVSVGTGGPISAPADLAPYGNGRIPMGVLAPVGVGDFRLWAPAAQAFAQMRSDAARAGVDIGVTSTYRSYDAQVANAKEKGLYSQGGWAAEPGTSLHGWGLAVDVDATPATLQWMRDNASRYGWVQDVPREPWHWDFSGS